MENNIIRKPMTPSSVFQFTSLSGEVSLHTCLEMVTGCIREQLGQNLLNDAVKLATTALENLISPAFSDHFSLKLILHTPTFVHVCVSMCFMHLKIKCILNLCAAFAPIRTT